MDGERDVIGQRPASRLQAEMVGSRAEELVQVFGWHLTALISLSIFWPLQPLGRRMGPSASGEDRSVAVLPSLILTYGSRS
ncbi:hypothetical protein PGTUg99_034064 [Puccinia graminis f. sp. tritici]|uniref:Uncharacterized protein n=1 Tax=Puccinia graminis f. sp. tritici TaxID=56615 RepID=A0A5B0Q9H5_PUCGR|nr:hypothetical protein PGTUg99_034064 [Puccinia graminis f. sp. tritici]